MIGLVADVPVAETAAPLQAAVTARSKTLA